MISKTHTSAQKPRGRQLNAKVCGSESTNFRPLCSDHFSNNDNSKTAQVLTLILARNCSSQRAASQPLSVFIGSKLPWSRKLFTAQPDGCSLHRTPFPNVVRMRTRSRWPRLWDLALDHGPKCIDGLRNLVRVITFPPHALSGCPLCEEDISRDSPFSLSCHSRSPCNSDKLLLLLSVPD